MEDATGTMNVMIFDDQAQKLVGVAAEDLIEEFTGEQISAGLGLRGSRTFVVAADKGCFVVKCILNDDVLQLNGSAQTAAGGGDLSEEDGPPASYSSSPQVKKENKVIKEEREAKRLKTGASEAEQTDAE